MPGKSSSLSIEPRFRIYCGRLAFGPGKAELLQHIESTGSITEAAKAMGMSYMRAWSLVKSMDHGFAEPLVSKVRGGHLRGGARLTATGTEVVRIYRELGLKAATATRGLTRQLTPLLKKK